MCAPDGGHNLTIYSAQFALNGPSDQSGLRQRRGDGDVNFYGSTAVTG